MVSQMQGGRGRGTSIAYVRSPDTNMFGKDTSMYVVLVYTKGKGTGRDVGGRMPSNPDGFDPPRNPQINGSQGALIEVGRSPCSAFSRDPAAATADRGGHGLRNLPSTWATVPYAYLLPDGSTLSTHTR